MKKLLILAVLFSTLTGTQANAAAVAGASVVGLSTSFGFWGTIGMTYGKEMAVAIEDSQDYLQTGNMSASLEQVVRDIQRVHPEMGDNEVIDAILFDSGTVIAN